MATITPRGNSFRVQQMTNGKRISKSFKCERLALAYKHELESPLFDVTTAGLIPMNTAISDYLDGFTGKDESIFQRLDFWTNQVCNLSANKIDKKFIVKSLDKLAASGKGNATVNRYKAALSSVFTYLIDGDLISVNPCRSIKSRKESGGVERYLTSDEYVSLMSATNKSKWDRLPLLVLMACTTGARRSELINLTWTDIDFSNKTASIADSKNGKPRLMPLTNNVITELMKFREIGHTPVFKASSSKHAYINFDRTFKTALAEAGITGFRFHDLRHSAASFLSAKGVPIQTISEVLGHSNIATTARYIHLSIENKRAVIDNTFNEFNVSVAI